MRRITMWFVSTVAAVVLLFSYRTSTSGPAAASGAAAGAAGAAAPGIVSGGSTAGPSSPGPSSPGPSSTSGSTGGGSSGGGSSGSGQTVVNGTVADTRWGPVQVQVTISAGKIVEVTALQVPNGNQRDDEINSFAVPQLLEEVLQAQSASINMISGATVTSDGYIRSLQAALDAANFGK
ncbi:MAG: hypothetical protein V7603_4097 [Micromonosporaceae bacterium]